MSAKTQTKLDREIEHTIDDETSDDELPANMQEREENRWQMAEAQRRTIEPGIMKLKVSTVTSAENSEQWAIDVAHPMLDDLRIFAEKPLHGWSEEYKIVRMLNWYVPGSRDPYELEFAEVFMRYDEDESAYAHGWHIVQPPDHYTSYRSRALDIFGLSDKIETITDMRPPGKNQYIWAMLGIGALSGPVIASSVAAGVLGTIALTLVTYLIASGFVVGAMDHE